MPTETFSTATDWTVPDGVYSLTMTLEGEKGAPNSDNEDIGGDGGRVKGDLDVTPGNTLYIRESAGGNGPGGAGAGGNSIDVRRGGTTLSDRLAVAAGGGGVGESFDNTANAGGAGGADTGEDGGQGGASTLTDGGGGGTQSAGGTSSGTATDGQFGPGGDGGDDQSAEGAGGGAGWYGGGGGESEGADNGNGFGASGGGGSNYDDGLTTLTANERGTSTRSHGSGGLATFDYTIVAPSNLQVTGTTADSVDLAWDELNDPNITVEEYRVYRATSSGSDTSDYTQIATTGASETTYSDTTVAEGVTYHYRVTAYGGGDESGVSNEVSTTTPLPAPSITGVSLA